MRNHKDTAKNRPFASLRRVIRRENMPAFMNREICKTEKLAMLSFPRRRESIIFNSFLDTGFRRYDEKRSCAKLSNNQKGFSLMELIVTVLIVAIFGSMIIVFFGTSIIKSADPITQVKKASDIHKVMENIKADYNKYPRWRASTIYAAGTVVIPTNVNGRYYFCITAGTSGLTEPGWPLAAAGEVNDGTARWRQDGRVHDANSLTGLQTNIGAEGTSQNISFGKYTVINNRFIKFDTSTGSEMAGTANDILKVTIKNDIGETLTELFMADHLL